MATYAFSSANLLAGLRAVGSLPTVQSTDAALVRVAAAPPPTPSPMSGIQAFFAKKLFGNVTYGEAGLGAAAIAGVTKLMKVW